MGEWPTVKGMQFSNPHWRQRKGFSQSQAAAKLGIPFDTLQNWEIARIKPVGFAHEALLKILQKR